MHKLENKKIVITRPRKQAASFAQLLLTQGAQPIMLPTIEIAPPQNLQALDNALKNLSAYDWLILTSVNGVEAVWDHLAVLEIDRIPDRIKVAAIGPKTAQALVQRGCTPDFVPQEFILEEIVPGLGLIEGKKILLARAELARSILPEMIRSSGGQVEDLVAYRTLPVIPDPTGIAALRKGVDVVTFTSPSTIDNFSLLAESAGLSITNLHGNPAFAYIGPITAQKAQEFGLACDITAKDYTVEGLVAAILEYFTQEEITYA